jgi:class 3 adenylate cyclase
MDLRTRSQEPPLDSRRPEVDPTREGPAQIGDLDPIRLRFRNDDVERQFRAHFANHNTTSIRVGYVLGALMWILWGVILGGHLGDERGLDLLIRYGLMIPLIAVGFALTFWRGHPRIWKWPVMFTLLVSGLTWITYVIEIDTMPADYGYVGLILMHTFAFSILRLPFALVGLFIFVTVPYYLGYAVWFGELQGIGTLLAIYYLASFSMLGLIASYVLEWKIRKLFLRERQLDYERGRSEALLLNTLPRAIVDRLKSRSASANQGRVAEEFGDVTVLFADAVGFTTQATKTPASDLVAALDDLFSRCDALADHYGLEKIKTVGDAYMAVAGVPRPRSDHAQAAAEMALALLDLLRDARWPSGDPILVRVGIASGPAVAGVIGRRKFAYDLWGDTVNLASRLESHARPGRILVSESVVSHLEGTYDFGPPIVVDLKGKGPTAARFLLGEDGATGLGSRPVTFESESRDDEQLAEELR